MKDYKNKKNESGTYGFVRLCTLIRAKEGK